jgi:pyridoxal phosphate enzyme (YggS family)
MSVNTDTYRSISSLMDEKKVVLVAVSKTKPAEDIRALYELGQRDFGENYVQELVDKQKELPADIRWHFIGHLQSNKVKFIAPFVHLIHGIDSLKLLKEVDKEAQKNNRTIDVLLQVHIASEETKFGWDAAELLEAAGNEVFFTQWPNVRIRGLMGMASFSDDPQKVRAEFHSLSELFVRLSERNKDLSIVSMGMSGDYRLALEEGSTMVRIGSLLFGSRP